MLNAIDTQPLNLNRFPSDIKELTPNEKGLWPHVIFGDTHGSEIKVIHQLIQYGFIKNTEDVQQAYQRLLSLCSRMQKRVHTEETFFLAPITFNKLQEQILAFNDILAIFKKDINKKNKSTITYVGNLLTGRHGYEYFILKIIHLLHKADIEFNILFSGYDLEAFFLEGEHVGHATNNSDLISHKIYAKDRATEKKRNDTGLWTSLARKYSSLFGSDKRKKTLFSDHNDLLSDYCSHLELLSFAITEDKRSDKNTKHIHILSHAPVAFRVIADLASHYDISYKDKTPEKLGDTIEVINQSFREDLFEPSGIHELDDDFLNMLSQAAFLSDLESIDLTTLPTAKEKNKCITSKENLILYCAWNGSMTSQEEDRPHLSKEKDYGILYVHGHTIPRDKNNQAIAMGTHIINTYNESGMHNTTDNHPANSAIIYDGKTFSSVLRGELDDENVALVGATIILAGAAIL
jgi:hypothetical protein